jgi:hypothetical protein
MPRRTSNKNIQMIKANELRVGSRVCIGGVLITLDIELLIFILKEDGFETRCEGIPLTPERLKECGFEIFPWGYVKKSSKGFGVRINLRSFNYEVSGNNPVKIQYIHQLQNLYFDLTGEEIENIKAGSNRYAENLYES